MRTDVKKRLRASMEDQRIAVLAGAHDGLSSRLVQEAGFDGVWASSFGISLASRCVADVDLVTLSETADIVRMMVDATDLPVLVDGNSGFGNAVNVIHMVRLLERAGSAGVCIEDNQYPKRCSLYDRENRELVSPAEMAGKIRAAVETRDDRDFLIVGRIESLIAAEGVEAAWRRADLYAEAGADALVVHAKSFAPLEEFLAGWSGGCPLVAIPTLYNHVSLEDLERHGYRLAIFPNQSIRAAIEAMRNTLAVLRRTGVGSSVDDLTVPLRDIYELVDLAAVEAAERDYIPAPEPIGVDTEPLIASRS
jgi:phosphoenolpyruvate phosphomutase